MAITKIEFDEYQGEEGSWRVSTSNNGYQWYGINVAFATHEAAELVAKTIELAAKLPAELDGQRISAEPDADNSPAARRARGLDPIRPAKKS